MSIHIGAKPGDISDIVLLPGDPYRARWAANKFLKNTRLVNDVRGMLGFTGEYKGRLVTIQGSGMGMPSLSIYVNELIQNYGVKTLIRIGSCGAMQPFIRVRDIIFAMSASNTNTPSSTIFKEFNFSAIADFNLLSTAVRLAKNKKIAHHVGGIYSSDIFYDERPDLNEQIERHGVLAVEMEAAELYNLAARYSCRALAVLTVSDHLKTGETLASSDREKSFDDMIEIALLASIGDD